MTKTQLLQGVSGTRELMEMMAFHKINPEGEADDHRTANLMAATFNASGNVKKPVKATDFIKKKVVYDDDAVQASFRAAAAAQKARAARK